MRRQLAEASSWEREVENALVNFSATEGEGRECAGAVRLTLLVSTQIKSKSGPVTLS